MSPASRFLLTNGVVLPPGETPPRPPLSSRLIQALTPQLAPTPTPSSSGTATSAASLTLLRSDPNLLFGSVSPTSPTLPQTLSLSNDLEQMIRQRFDSSLASALQVAMEARDVNAGEELAVTALVVGNREKLGEISLLDEETVARVFDVFVHIGMYVPPLFEADGNRARLAVVCGKRNLAMAKYSDWARLNSRLGKGSCWRV